jgi:2'-5' RNA ligase
VPDKRIFVAIHYQPTADFLQFYGLIKNEFGTSGIKWTDPHNFHLTLHFLGDTPDDRIRTLIPGLQTLASQTDRFTLIPGRPGFFGSAAQPRVLWLEMNDPAGKATELANAIKKLTLGWTEDEGKPFVAHLTLARPKYFQNPDLLKKRFAEWAGLKLSPVEIKQFHLVWSTLTPSGPVYRNLRSFALNATGS